MPKYVLYTAKSKFSKFSKFNRLQIEVLFLPNINPPYIGPSNLSFVRIYVQGVLTGFYGMLNRYTAFLTHVDTRQLPTQMLIYIGKKRYHIGKNVADVGFVWHPDISTQ